MSQHGPDGSPRRGAAERGVFRGCCLGLAGLVALTVLAVVLVVRLSSAPNLGAPPAGPNDGDTPGTIATTLAGQVATHLISESHATVTLSERDLTVLAATENPDPNRFHDPEVRARNGFLLVDAQNSLGPLQVVTTARVQVALDSAGHLSARVVQVDVGQQTIPDWMRSAVDSRGSGALTIDPFLSNPGLLPLRNLLECGSVVASGFQLSFHRPGSPSDPGRCGTVA